MSMNIVKTLETLFKEDLESEAHAPCNNCGMTHETEPLFLTSRCHPNTGLKMAYFQGELFVTCATCDGRVCRVAIASSPTQ